MGKRKTELRTGEYYHVYNCGPGKSDIFHDTRDFGHFLLLLEYCNTTKPIKHLKDKIDWENTKNPFTRNRVTGERDELVTIEAYCLLPNHFHLLIKQNADGGISEFMARVCGGYSRKCNARYQTFGTRFQGRFQAKHVDSDAYLYELLAYVPANYIVHGIQDTTKYASSLDYAFGDNVFITKSQLLKQEFQNYQDYMSFALPQISETRRKRGKDIFD